MVAAIANSRLAKLDRVELVLESPFSYDGISPVRMRVKKRGGRFDVSDEGGAVAAAGVDPARLVFPEQITVDRKSVNVTRRGVVWLPGFARSCDQWLAELPELVAQGSITLYDALLALDD
jgi:hypothetical protein